MLHPRRFSARLLVFSLSLARSQQQVICRWLTNQTCPRRTVTCYPVNELCYPSSKTMYAVARSWLPRCRLSSPASNTDARSSAVTLSVELRLVSSRLLSSRLVSRCRGTGRPTVVRKYPRHLRMGLIPNSRRLSYMGAAMLVSLPLSLSSSQVYACPASLSIRRSIVRFCHRARGGCLK